MERCRSHPVWEARTDFGSVGVIDDADQMPTTPRHRGGRCESGLSEIKRFGVGASLFERNENRVHISDALLISPECPVPAGASRPAGTPVPSAQLLEPHSSASPPVLLHCVHHGKCPFRLRADAQSFSSTKTTHESCLGAFENHSSWRAPIRVWTPGSASLI